MEDSVFWITIDERAPDHSWLIIGDNRDDVFVSLRDERSTFAPSVELHSTLSFLK